MSLVHDREKVLPIIPVDDIDVSETVVEDEELWLIPSSEGATFAEANKTLPPVNVESTLSEEEMGQLHELWNGAAMTARVYRMRRRNHNPRRVPAPISILEPPNSTPALLVPSSANPSLVSTTPTATGTRKRWGFLSARSFSELEAVEEKTPNILEKLRAMAQERLKKKLRYAKSTPNLGDQNTPRERGQPVRRTLVANDSGASSPQDQTWPERLAAPETNVQQEGMDENAIYFTVDPNWRASRGSVEFECITPVPDNDTSLGRPDSPLLHRHHSLDQLSFAAQKVAAMGFPEADPRDEILDLIDELHACLEA